MKSNYTKLAITLVISFVIMYSVMFFNVAEINHIYLSTTRFYMALLMVSPMALVMLFMMGKMYPDEKKNLLIRISGAVVFVLAFVLLRSQTPIKDVQYMKAMIPHHSSAILTSENSDISDPEVKKLAQEIIKTQEEEIAQMKSILERMNK
jgi:uncharacterized protein (DUF305 family)